MIALLLAAAALADGTRCVASDKTGLRFEQWSYVGDAYPTGDVPVGSQTWYRADRQIHATTWLANGERIVEGALSWEWDRSATSVTDVKSTGKGTVTYYQTTVRIWSAGGEPVDESLAAVVTSPMRCERSVDDKLHP